VPFLIVLVGYRNSEKKLVKAVQFHELSFDSVYATFEVHAAHASSPVENPRKSYPWLSIHHDANFLSSIFKT
jgi:hypothetical protein